MLSSSRPASPTKGSPRTSSSTPGASPISNQSAVSSPTPNTVFFRLLCRPQASQASTLCLSAGQSIRTIRAGRSESAPAAPDVLMDIGKGAEMPMTSAGALSTAPPLPWSISQSRERQTGARPNSSNRIPRRELKAFEKGRLRPPVHHVPDNNFAASL